MSAPNLSIALQETVMRSGVVRWRPTLIDQSYKIVWRGDLYPTAAKARAIALAWRRLMVKEAAR